MKKKKEKTVVLTVSKRFLAGHPRAGQETGFRQKIERGEKIHTLRGNAEHWLRACELGYTLSIREWSGKPYRSPQEVIRTLPAGGWGAEQVALEKTASGLEAYTHLTYIPVERLAANDGLALPDFEAWLAPSFGGCGKLGGVIIHFTDFYYSYE
jgi:hypothetical protein